MIRLLLMAWIAASSAATTEEAVEDRKHSLWFDMAEWYINNHMPEQALDMVRRLRESGEQTSDLDLIQARALVAQGTPDEARRILEEMMKRSPRDARAWQTMGVIQADGGELDKAVATLRQAVTLDPDHAPSHNNLGFLLYGMRRCDEAVDELEAATTADPTVPRYRNNLAFALVCAGDPQRALKLFRSMGAEADARYNMGVAYENLDKVPSAILQYREAVDADPDHAKAKAAIAALDTPGAAEAPTGATP